MAKVGTQGQSTSKKTADRCKHMDLGDAKPSTNLTRQHDMHRTCPSLGSEGRNYGMFSECSSNAPYAGCLSREDTKPCAGEGDRMEIDDEAEEDSCPSDELVQLMAQEVATYRKSLKRDRRYTMCPFREFQGPRRVRNHVASYRVRRNIWCASAGSSSGYVSLCSITKVSPPQSAPHSTRSRII